VLLSSENVRLMFLKMSVGEYFLWVNFFLKAFRQGDPDRVWGESVLSEDRFLFLRVKERRVSGEIPGKPDGPPLNPQDGGFGWAGFVAKHFPW